MVRKNGNNSRIYAVFMFSIEQSPHLYGHLGCVHQLTVKVRFYCTKIYIPLEISEEGSHLPDTTVRELVEVVVGQGG